MLRNKRGRDKQKRKKTEKKDNAPFLSRSLPIVSGAVLGLGIGILAGKPLSKHLVRRSLYKNALTNRRRLLRKSITPNDYSNKIVNLATDIRTKIDPRRVMDININNLDKKVDITGEMMSKKIPRRQGEKLYRKIEREQHTNIINPVISTGTGVIGLGTGLTGGYLYNRKQNNAQKQKRSR